MYYVHQIKIYLFLSLKPTISFWCIYEQNAKNNFYSTSDRWKSIQPSQGAFEYMSLHSKHTKFKALSRRGLNEWVNQRERKEINPSHNVGEVKGCGTMHYVRGIHSSTCFTSSCVLCGTRYESIAGVCVYCTCESLYVCNSNVSFSKSHKRSSKNNWPSPYITFFLAHYLIWPMSVLGFTATYCQL